MGGQGAKAGSIAWADDGTTPTLKASPSGGNTVPDVCYAIQGNMVDRDTNQNGPGYMEDDSPTLNTVDRHAVCYPETARALTARHDSSPCVDRGQNVVCYAPNGNHCGHFEETNVLATLETKYHFGSGGDAAMVCYDARGNGDGETAPTLTGDHERRVTDYTAVCVGNGQLHQTDMGDKTGALNCMHDQQAVVYPGVQITSNVNRSNPKPGAPAPTLTNDSRHLLVADGHLNRKYIVRRLTPTECARLQGFPDEWCEGLGGSDSAIYKAYGNGLALPCAYDVMQRIARFVERERRGTTSSEPA